MLKIQAYLGEFVDIQNLKNCEVWNSVIEDEFKEAYYKFINNKTGMNGFAIGKEQNKLIKLFEDLHDLEEFESDDEAEDFIDNAIEHKFDNREKKILAQKQQQQKELEEAERIKLEQERIKLEQEKQQAEKQKADEEAKIKIILEKLNVPVISEKDLLSLGFTIPGKKFKIEFGGKQFILSKQMLYKAYDIKKI